MTHPSFEEVSASEAAQLADAGEALLLDVREPHEWAAGHARSATHVPLAALPGNAPPKDRPVIAVCHFGGRSGMAAQAMAAAGYDVRNLTGGMDAWARAGLPVVDDQGNAGTIVG